MSEVHVTYQPRLRDVVHAARITRRNIFRRWDRVVALALAGFALFSLYRGALVTTGVCAALAVVEWFDLLPMSALVAYVRFKMDARYRQPFDLTLSSAGLQFRTRGITSQIEWTFFTRYCETERAFVLSHGGPLPTVIPKAAFSTEAELNETRAILSAGLPERSA